MKRAAAALVAFALVGLGAGCSREPRLVRGEARLSPADGARVLVAERGDELEAASDVVTLHDGARVRLLGGDAVLRLQGGATLELRGGSEVVLGSRPTLVSGPLLVLPAPSTPLIVTSGGTRITALGPARLDRDLATTTASYATGLRLESAGRRLIVPALRQASVPSLGEIPNRAQPLAYDGNDPWDRRFLGDAIGLGAELEARSRGFGASLAPDQGRTVDFYRMLLPGLETETGFAPTAGTSDRAPGETLVGLAIALAGRRGSFVTRSSEIFDFRDDGADWGLVALEQGVAVAPGVVEAVDAAIGRASLAFAPEPPSSSPPAASGGRGTPDGGRPAGSSSEPPARGPLPVHLPPAQPLPPVVQGPGPGAPATPVPEPLLAPVVDLLAGLLPGIVVVEPDS